MKLNDLSADQLRKLSESLKPKLGYIKRLRVRMEEVNFPDFDRFYRDVMMAEILIRDAIEQVDSLRGFKGY